MPNHCGLLQAEKADAAPAYDLKVYLCHFQTSDTLSLEFQGAQPPESCVVVHIRVPPIGALSEPQLAHRSVTRCLRARDDNPMWAEKRVCQNYHMRVSQVIDGRRTPTFVNARVIASHNE
jgi:hypothetical protein